MVYYVINWDGELEVGCGFGGCVCGRRCRRLGVEFVFRCVELKGKWIKGEEVKISFVDCFFKKCICGG